ncbi:MAG TPA: PAS domain S-box protein [Blastocatellia bacterium]|nr:PAS domain S-box protein [Blastocatellia bacterium]
MITCRIWKLSFIVWAACLIICSTDFSVFGQTTSIAQAVEDKDRNFEPDHSGEQVVVRGIITSLQVRRSSPHLSYFAYVQDQSGAVIAYGKDDLPGIAEGDLVEVKGTVGHVHGMPELLSPEFVRLGRGTIKPIKSEISLVNSAQCLACLVEVTGTVRSVSFDPTDPQQHYVFIEDETGSINISVVGKVWTPSDSSLLQPGAQVKVIGTTERYKGSEESTPVPFIEVPHPGDLIVLKHAPLLSGRQILIPVGVLLLVVAAPLAWSETLRRRVKAKTAELQREIAERQHSQQALAASEKHYRLLFHSNPLPMWVYDRDTLQFLAVNEAAVRNYGYSLEEFSSMTIKEIRPAEDIAILLNEVEHITEGLGRTMRFRHKKKDGTIIDVEITSHTLIFQGKNAELVLANDITELKRAEQALIDSESELRALFGAMTDVVVVFDHRGQYVKIAPTNPGPLFRLPDELIGRTLHEVFPLQLADLFLGYIKTVLETGKPLNVEYRLNLNGTAAWFEGVLSPMSADSVFLISRDVTWRKQADEQLKQSQEQLRQSQRLEPIGRLAGGVAHDFNNLLTAIIGYSELLLADTASDDARFGNLSEIKKAGQRAAGLTRQLLAFSRKQILQPKVINLNSTVLNMHKMLRRLIGEDIEIISLLDHRIGQVNADPGQVEQVILNLAVNARDAMPDGGKITIETLNLDVPENNTRLNGIPAGNYVTLTVQDSGCGMDEETKSHIFEPFFTTKETGKGTGLGLATVYGIVQQSGGYISVESAPGKGTSFCVYLPRTEAAAETDAVRFNGLDRETAGETILVVEDEDLLLRLIQTTLRQAGYKVLTATNGTEAIEQFQLNRDIIKLVLTDIVMPQMGGRRLVERLYELGSSARILFMSGYTSDSIVRDELIGDRIQLLQKPFSPTDLTAKIRDVLDDARYHVGSSSLMLCQQGNESL